MHRFFIDNIADEVILDGEEFQHAKNVLRVEEGEEVILLDNTGYEYRSIVSKIGKKELLLHVVGKEIGSKEAETDVCLLFGYIKNADKNEFIVQKAVELGVKKIGVFSSKYSSAYMNDNKLARLNKVSKEAAKQCGRSIAPEVVYFETLSDALDYAEGYEHKLFACEFAQKSDFLLSELNGSTAIVVGSEGGFATEEFDEAREKGFGGITLGKRILRAETAAISFLSIVMYEVGELK